MGPWANRIGNGPYDGGPADLPEIWVPDWAGICHWWWNGDLAVYSPVYLGRCRFPSSAWCDQPENDSGPFSPA